jgi:hypothetical protein
MLVVLTITAAHTAGPQKQVLEAISETFKRGQF